MRTELAALNDTLPGLDWLRITDRKSGAIKLTPLDGQPETRNLRRLKRAIRDRWGQVPLIDMVTEAALRTGMLGHLTAVGSREALERSVLWERLLLIAYAYGTNTGISAATPRPATTATARLTCATPPGGTSRSTALAPSRSSSPTRRSRLARARSGGQSTTTVASDSTHFRAYDHWANAPC
jgi:hypothetical protein